MQEQADRIEHQTIQREGVKTVKPTNPAPLSYAYGNAGQLYLTDREEISRSLREKWAVLMPLKTFKKPD